MKVKWSGDTAVALRAVQKLLGTVDQRASGNRVNIQAARGISIGGDVTGTVISDGEVWINGEKCYSKSLVEELDEAYKELEIILNTFPRASHEWVVEYTKARKRVLRARGMLDLA